MTAPDNETDPIVPWPPESPGADGIPVEPIPFARPIAIPAEIRTERIIDPFMASGTRLQTLIDIFIILGLILVLQVVAEFVFVSIAETRGLAPLPDADDSRNLRQFLIPLIGFRAVSVAFVIAVMLRLRGQPASSVGLTARNLLADIGIGFAATAVAYAGILIAVGAMYLFWEDAIVQMRENAEGLTRLFPNLGTGGFFVLSILIGFYEELFFRGFLMTRLRHLTRGWTSALLISTAFFTFLHAPDQTTPALVAITVLALIFGITTIWKKSIVPAIVGHALFDFSQFLFISFQMGDSWK